MKLETMETTSAPAIDARVDEVEVEVVTMVELDSGEVVAESPLDRRIAEARRRLARDLTELQERAARAKRLVSPVSLVAPWAIAAVAMAVGFALGRLGRPRRRAR